MACYIRAVLKPTKIPFLHVLLLLLLSLALSSSVLAAEAPRPRPGTRYLYLIRHGAYDRVDSLDDRTANGLNTLGHVQARLLAERLRSLPIHPRVLVTSGLTRARETGDELASVLHLEAARDSLLEECSPPATTDSTATDADRAESAACSAQLEAAWARYVRPSPEADAHDLLVCHGNVIRWFLARALQADTKRWITMSIGNASLTILAVRPDGTVRLVMYSDVGHIPVEKQTWTGSGPGWLRP